MHVPEPSETPIRWIPIDDAALPEEGAATELVIEGELIAVFRNQGKLFALEALCAHHGGPLSEGNVQDDCVTCPWHGWTYRLEDGTQVSSGEKLIRSYPIREANGAFEIGLF